MLSRVLLATAGTVAAVLGTALPSSASGSAVLTTGGPDGAAAAVGDVLTAPLATGTSATVNSSPTGNSGVSCKESQFTAAVTGNPDAPGAATETVTAHTMDKCTSNVIGVLGVESITMNNLPYHATVTSKGTLTVVPDNGSHIQATVNLRTLLGTVNCTYQAKSLTGTTGNADSSLSFVNQQLAKTSGSPLCFPTGYFTAKYAPVTDGGVPIHVN
ncbi:Tat pathway signal sequence domain protein [Streptomyces sp. NPDC090073]|uniref:Tat pathway signal sequence domain protein n=1 Tax=Streptomyces sp. NPDC090073 TaxID=3365936 RepID=UPI0037FB6BEF